MKIYLNNAENYQKTDREIFVERRTKMNEGRKYQVEIYNQSYSPWERVTVAAKALFSTLASGFIGLRSKELREEWSVAWSGLRKIKVYTDKSILEIESNVGLNEAKLLTVDPQPCYQVPVLDQRFESGGGERCGYHALKNGLIALGVVLDPAGFDASLFTSKKFYREFYTFAKSVRENSDGDLAIGDMINVLKGLETSRMLPPAIKPLQQLLQRHPNAISLLNRINRQFVGIDQGNLCYLANLAEMRRKDEPATHAFVMGSNEHWITLVMQREADGTVKYFGCDSWNNETHHYQAHIEALNHAMQTPQVFLDAYEHSLGEGNRRRARELPDRENMLSQKDIYIDRIDASYHFMERTGWLEKSGSQEKEHLRNLLTFIKAFKECLPEPCIFLNTMAERLEKALDPNKS